MPETQQKGCALLRRWLNDHPDITQSTLAKDLGVTPGMISLLSTGRARPSLDLASLLEARTAGMVRGIDWLDEETQARREYIARSSELG